MIARGEQGPRAWWVALAAVPLGFGVGPAFLYAAARARALSYAIYGAAWLAVCLTGLVLTLVYPDNSNGDGFGSFRIVMTWIALEMGVGRGRGVDDGGLVGVNHAPESVLVELPGVDRALARRIAQVRGEVDGFSSVEDLGTVLDLPAEAVEEMRDRAIFLPRGA